MKRPKIDLYARMAGMLILVILILGTVYLMGKEPAGTPSLPGPIGLEKTKPAHVQV